MKLNAFTAQSIHLMELHSSMRERDAHAKKQHNKHKQVQPNVCISRRKLKIGHLNVDDLTGIG